MNVKAGLNPCTTALHGNMYLVGGGGTPISISPMKSPLKRGRKFWFRGCGVLNVFHWAVDTYREV